MATASGSIPSSDIVEQARAMRRALAALEGAMSPAQKRRYEGSESMERVRPSGAGVADELRPMIIVLPPETDGLEPCDRCGRRRRKQ